MTLLQTRKQQLHEGALIAHILDTCIQKKSRLTQERNKSPTKSTNFLFNNQSNYTIRTTKILALSIEMETLHSLKLSKFFKTTYLLFPNKTCCCSGGKQLCYHLLRARSPLIPLLPNNYLTP